MIHEAHAHGALITFLLQKGNYSARKKLKIFKKVLDTVFRSILKN